MYTCFVLYSILGYLMKLFVYYPHLQNILQANVYFYYYLKSIKAELV